MVDIVVPPALRQARVRFGYVDPSGTSVSRYNGAAQTTGYGGDRVRATVDFTQHGGRLSSEQSARAQLKAFMMALRGKQNRVYLTDVSSSRRGTLPAVELFSNADFSSGSTGWSGYTGSGTVTPVVSDGSLRVRADSSGEFGVRQSISLTANVPHALRVLVRPGQNASQQIFAQLTLSASFYRTLTVDGYAVGAGVPVDATARNQYPFFVPSSQLPGAGDYKDLLFTSLSRCLLVDGGGNRLLYSDTPSNAAWSKVRCSASAVAGTAPDSATDAEAIIDDGTAGASHYFVQSATRTAEAADLCVYGFFKRRSGTRDIRLVVGNTSSNYSSCIFDLLNGTAGTVSNVGTATFGRAFIRNAGGGWFFCCLVSRAEAATTIYSEFALTSAGSITYNGDSTSSIYAWRIGSEVSSTPTRGAQTTSAVVSPESQPGGIGIYVKGGRSPSEGELLAAIKKEDWVEIDGQLCMAVADLDLDAVGGGFLQLSPPPRKPVADNTPIIVHKPMGRFMYRGDDSGWANEPGPISSASIELEQVFPA